MKWNFKPYKGPPYVFIIRVKGEKTKRRIIAFDKEHIQNQLPGKEFKILRRKDD